MYFIDVQGTLIDDVERMPIRGAVEFIEYLNRENVPYIAITNNTKHHSARFLKYLNSVGLNIPKNSYIDPLMILKQRLNAEKVAAYGSPEFLEVLVSMGYRLNYDAPSVVLVGIKKEFSNDEFADMIGFILNGAKLVGMHATTIYAKDSKRYPGVGAILKMIQFATGASYIVVGKPSEPFYDEALKIVRENSMSSVAKFQDITIISDDVKGDLVGAKELGMKTVFVLSGKYRRAEEILPVLSAEERPDIVKSHMEAVYEAHKRGEL